MTQLKAYDISVLVNNVGLDVLNPYHELTEQEIVRLITVNCLPIAVLNRRFIPRLLGREKKSAIINLASVAGKRDITQGNYRWRYTMYTQPPRPSMTISADL
jgi:17beta-estradiol 17-dehydrogenase / very-long-chain 3-oxoacyl-CoA reductase